MASIAALVSSFSATLVEICTLRLDLRVGDGPGGAPPAVARTAEAEMDSLAGFLLEIPAPAPDAPEKEPEPEPEAACLAEAEALTLVGLGSSGRAARGLATPRVPLSNARLLAASASLPAVLALRVATTLLTKALLLRAFCWLFADMGLDTKPVETEAAETEAAEAVPIVAEAGGTGRAAVLCPFCCDPPPVVASVVPPAVDCCF